MIRVANNVVPAAAKWTFTTRRVNRDDVVGISKNFSHAVSGDLVLAKVSNVSSHSRAQLASGRPSNLSAGDYIVLCCADRYAPDQFEGRAFINPEGADMLAGGGVIGKANVAHAKMSAPTQLTPIGLLTDETGDVINIANYGVPVRQAPTDITVIGVVGASMNAGKTTATAALAHGLAKAGRKVAAIKATGTGAFGDFNAFVDAGVHHVSDFTDAGMATTYLQSIENIEDGLSSLLAEAKDIGVDTVVVELADGIYQKETAALLEQSSLVRNLFSGWMFASGDAVSVVGGVRHLRAIGLNPIAVSGVVSLSPLAVGEAEAMTGVKIFKKNELMDGAIADALVSKVERTVDMPCGNAA